MHQAERESTQLHSTAVAQHRQASPQNQKQLAVAIDDAASLPTLTYPYCYLDILRLSSLKDRIDLVLSITRLSLCTPVSSEFDYTSRPISLHPLPAAKPIHVNLRQIHPRIHTPRHPNDREDAPLTASLPPVHLSIWLTQLRGTVGKSLPTTTSPE